MRTCCMVLFAVSGCFGVPGPTAPALDGSVGLPHQGVITGALALPKSGPGFKRFRTDDVRWGNPRLVRAIQRAAARVAEERPGGAALVVADIAARNGGQVPRHRSHRTGRDADLLFYAQHADGRPMQSPGFVRFQSDGLAAGDNGGFVRFDVDRNWRLVRALMTDPEAGIQYLFVARWLEALLVEHAIASDEDLEVIWRAQVVLRQPGDSAAHDDHFHIRIGCTPEEAAGGCEGGGPHRSWLPLAQAPALDDAHVLAALFDGQDEPL